MSRRVVSLLDEITETPVVEEVDVSRDRGDWAVHGLSLDVRAVELVGIAGVSGSGQRELAEAIFGLCQIDSGRVLVDGHLVTNGGHLEPPGGLRIIVLLEGRIMGELSRSEFDVHEIGLLMSGVTDSGEPNVE